MEKRIFIIPAVLTGINAIVDFCYALLNYDSIILELVFIVGNKCVMFGVIHFIFWFLNKIYKKEAQNDKRFRIWIVISGIVFVVMSVALHVDLVIQGDYMFGNGIAWIASAMTSFLIAAFAGRAAYDRENKK